MSLTYSEGMGGEHTCRGRGREPLPLWTWGPLYPVALGCLSLASTLPREAPLPSHPLAGAGAGWRTAGPQGSSSPTPPRVINRRAPSQETGENEYSCLLNQGSTDLLQCFIFERSLSTKASRTAALRVWWEMGYLHGLKISLINGLLITKGKIATFLLAESWMKWTMLISPMLGLMDIMCSLRRTHHFCRVSAENI